MSKVSVVIIAKNEEDNIADSLESVRWADEIVVVDDESIDKTVEICESYGAKVFKKKLINEGEHRNWAYEKAGNEWILSLDADERVTEELAAEIQETVKTDNYDVYNIWFNSYFGKKLIKYGDYGVASRARLFRKGFFYYKEGSVHPEAVVKGRRAVLKGRIDHFGYKDISDYIVSFNRYTTRAAFDKLQKCERFNWFTVCRRSLHRAWKSYFYKKGYKDGFIGGVFAVFAGLHIFISYAKYKEMMKEEGLE